MNRVSTRTSERNRHFPSFVAAAAIALLVTGCSHDRLMGDAGRIAEPRLVPGAAADSSRRGTPQANRPVALLVLGSSGTEVFDLLAPAEILSSSGEFDVFTVAGDTKPKPLTGGVAIIPDFSLESAPPADLIVLPAVRDPAEPQLVSWIRSRSVSKVSFLSVCEGARIAGEAGLLEGRRVTTHFFAIDELQKRHPGAVFAEGHRYVADGPLISTAGVSAATDGALFAVARFAGHRAAERTAEGLGIAWKKERDPSGQNEGPEFAFEVSEWARLIFNTLFLHRRDKIAVLVTPGVSEMAVAAALDTFPRGLRTWQVTVSMQDQPVTTRHGFRLVAEQHATPAHQDDFDLWILPSGTAPESDAWARRFVKKGTPVVSLAEKPPGQALDGQLGLVAEFQNVGTAEAVARMIELPWESSSHPPSRY